MHHGDLPHHPSALALAVISAGPGADLQQQLYSLLCSMVKVAHTPIAADVPRGTADQSLNARRCLCLAAVTTAAALVAGAGAVQQPLPSS
jgi:hypothetical protein